MNYESRWLGQVDYAHAFQMQETLAQRVKHSLNGVILGLEHPEVITLGLRGDNKDITAKSDIPIVHSSRGGQATYHNPGQLVIYPICPIKNWQFGAREWVETLLEVTKKSLIKCNIIVVSQNNGLFTEKGKIASIGLNLKGGVSTHGIAINVSNSLSGFDLIRTCGVQKQPMDRVIDHYLIEIEELFAIWCQEFNAVFLTKKERFLTSRALQI